MHKRKSQKSVGPSGYDLRHLAVRHPIIGVERRKEHRARNAGFFRSDQVCVERGVGVPRTREAVALAGMAMAVDDHIDDSRSRASVPASGWGRRLSCRIAGATAGIAAGLTGARCL